MQTKTRAAHKAWIISILISFSLGLSLSAYQQGSYFLFDVSENAEESSVAAGRIAVAASVFKKQEVEKEAQFAVKEVQKSEFESNISIFETTEAKTELSDFKILEDDTKKSELESAFGEKPKAPTSFFFTY